MRQSYVWMWIVCVLGLCSPSAVAASPRSGWPAVQASNYIVMDGATGQVLLEHHAYIRRPPASTTKMMTAYLAIRSGKWNDLVTVSPRAASTGGSRLHIQARERYTLGELVEGLLLRSGNDAAVAIAEFLGGSVSAFAESMTVAAWHMGALSTHFENPNGLPAKGHYSTAHDLALIAAQALKLPRFRDIVRQREGILQGASGSTRAIHNTNRLLWEFPEATGVKTGTTSAAGKCLVAAARRGSFEPVVVLLNDPDRFSDAARLLAYALDHYRVIVRPVYPGARPRLKVQGALGELLSVQALTQLHAVVSVEDLPQLRLHRRYVQVLKVPVLKGQPVGVATLELRGRVLDRSLIVAAREMPIPSWWQRLRFRLGHMLVLK